MQLDLTAMNAKTEVASALLAEFRQCFEGEPVEALQWAFRAWRKESPFFPALADIEARLQLWHRVRAEEVREREQAAEKRKLEEARKAGQLVSLPEVMAQLKEVAKMPEAPVASTRTVTRREVPPALQLTREQIEARRPQERAEVERVRKQMEEA